MDYKKEYEEALVRAKEIQKVDFVDCPHKEIAEYIFPVLKNEDERIKKWLYNIIKNGSYLGEIPFEKNRVLAWIEKQGQTFTKKDIDNAWLKGMCDAKRELEKQVEQKPALSEEDEKMLDFAIRAVGLCKQYAINHQVNGYSNLPDTPKKYEELQDWLKSIKPQSAWKPSDEQIAAIEEAACYSSVFSEKTIDNLISLSKQLKKIREE